MSILDRIKNFFNRIVLKKDESEELLLDEGKELEFENNNNNEGYIPEDYPKDEIVSMLDGDTLDASSIQSQNKLRHNLEVLIQRAKDSRKN